MEYFHKFQQVAGVNGDNGLIQKVSLLETQVNGLTSALQTLQTDVAGYHQQAPPPPWPRHKFNIFIIVKNNKNVSYFLIL